MCSCKLEILTINCKPFYSLRESSSVVLLVAYIPPDANDMDAVNQLAAQVVAAGSAHPNSIIIVRVTLITQI